MGNCQNLRAETHLVSQVLRILADRVAADLVGRRYRGVEGAGGVVAGQPGGFAVERVVAAAVVLFLARVDDGDPVCEDGECGHIFG